MIQKVYTSKIYSLKEANAMHRKQGLVALLKYPFSWGFIKEGIDSGFSPCCIVHFKIRSFGVSFLEAVFGQKGQSIVTDHMDKSKFKGYIRHVLCPFCENKYKPEELKYYSCEAHHDGYCEWFQFKKSTCSRCGNKDMVKLPNYKYARLV